MTARCNDILWLSVKEPSQTMTSRCADAVTLRIEQSADLHQVTVPLCDVFIHSALQQECIVATPHHVNALSRRIDEYVWFVGHEVPHALVGWYLRRLKIIVTKNNDWRPLNKLM